MAAQPGRLSRHGWEESPDSGKQWCRVTPGQGNLTDSATENRPPSRLGYANRLGKGETVG